MIFNFFFFFDFGSQIEYQMIHGLRSLGMFPYPSKLNETKIVLDKSVPVLIIYVQL